MTGLCSPPLRSKKCICNIVSLCNVQMSDNSLLSADFFTLVNISWGVQWNTNTVKGMYTLITPGWPYHTDAFHNPDGPQQGLYCRGPMGPTDNYLLITLQHLRSSQYSPHQCKHCEGFSISMLTQYHSVACRLAISFGLVAALVWVD